MKNIFNKVKNIVNHNIKKLNNNKFFQNFLPIYKRFSLISVTEASAVASYYLLLSIFPILIFLVSIYSIFNQGQLQDYMSKLAFQGFIPDEVYSVLKGILDDIINSSRSYSVLSISVLTLLWTSGKGIGALLNSLNRIYQRKHLKNAYIRQLISSFGIFLFAFILVLFLFLSVITDRVFEWLNTIIPQAENSIIPRITSRYGTTFILILTLFTLLYYLISGRRGRIIDAIIGSLFTTLSWIIFPFFFSIYVIGRSKFSFLYGSVAGIIILLLWLYFSCTMVLMGAFIHTESIRYSIKNGKVKVIETVPKIKKTQLLAYERYKLKYNKSHTNSKI